MLDPRELKLLVKPLDLSVMLFNIYEASKDPNIGFLDAESRLTTISNDMTRKHAKIKQSLIEGALASCNLMAESGKFWHPLNKNIDEFIADIIKVTGKSYRFDKEYHLFFDDKNIG